METRHGYGAGSPAWQSAATSARSAFIARTYNHLFGAVITFTLLEVFYFTSGMAEGMARAMLGAVLWQLGYPEQAQASFRQAVVQGQEARIACHQGGEAAERGGGEERPHRRQEALEAQGAARSAGAAAAGNPVAEALVAAGASAGGTRCAAAESRPQSTGSTARRPPGR